MKKLELHSLQVDSFDTAAVPAGARGTVMANSAEQPIDTGLEGGNPGTNTEGPTCGAEHTCGYYYETCVETYEYSCAPCDASNWCDTSQGC